MVDKAVETEKEVQLKMSDAVFEKIKLRVERNEDSVELVNSDWQKSGLYKLLLKQYEDSKLNRGMST